MIGSSNCTHQHPFDWTVPLDKLPGSNRIVCCLFITQLNKYSDRTANHIYFRTIKKIHTKKIKQISFFFSLSLGPIRAFIGPLWAILKIHIMSFALIDAAALKMFMLPVYHTAGAILQIVWRRRSFSSKIRQFMAKFESVILFDVIILWLLIVKLKLFKFLILGTVNGWACVWSGEKLTFHTRTRTCTDPHSMCVQNSGYTAYDAIAFWCFCCCFFFLLLPCIHHISLGFNWSQKSIEC